MIVLRFLLSLVLFQIPTLFAGLVAARIARSSREQWQLLAWVPVLPLAIWGIFTTVATTRDPTSHNLGGLENRHEGRENSVAPILWNSSPVRMSRLRFRISMSLDGYAAGPRQSVENPLGIDGMRLHEWVFPLKFWREMQGQKGGEVNASSRVIEQSVANIGATIMGRNMFGGHPGAWSRENPWNGWWGKNPPFHHPVFVLTHHARAPLTLDGGTTFTFVTDGIESALEQAQRAAKGKDVSLAGGAHAAQQYLRAGLVDEMLISQVPVLLGDGERLFEGVDDLHGLELVETVAEPNVTHLRLARK